MYREGWNHLHHWLGRLTIISAWATIYLGIYMAHGSIAYNASLAIWLSPVVAMMGSLALADITLSIMASFRNIPAPGPPIGSVDSPWGRADGSYGLSEFHQKSKMDMGPLLADNHEVGKPSKSANLLVMPA
jgi:hypothetical protein